MAKKKTKKVTKKKRKSNRNCISPMSSSDNERWKVEGAADTMMRFQEIRSDSKLMSKAKKELARREKAISKARKA